MKDIKEVFAENLLQLRKSAGFTQSDLAEKLNYSDKAVSKWERAEAVPDVSVLIAIAFLFGVSVDFLVKEHTAEETEKIYSDKRANVGLIVTLITFMALMLCQIVVYLSLSGVGDPTDRSIRCRFGRSPRPCLWRYGASRDFSFCPYPR